MNPEEQALIRKALRGDADAINAVAERYAAFVNRVAWRLVRNSADAADITQEVLLKTVGALAQLEAVEGFQAWLYRIAYRTSLNWIRSRRREPAMESEGLDELPAEEPPPDIEADREAEIANLTQAADALPYPLYLVTRMFYFEQRSCREIAGTLGISEANVKVQLHRARRMLRLRLENRV